MLSVINLFNSGAVVLEGLGIRTESVNGYVTDSRHDAAEGAHGGEDPSHPDGPQKTDNAG